MARSRLFGRGDIISIWTNANKARGSGASAAGGPVRGRRVAPDQAAGAAKAQNGSRLASTGSRHALLRRHHFRRAADHAAPAPAPGGVAQPAAGGRGRGAPVDHAQVLDFKDLAAEDVRAAVDGVAQAHAAEELARCWLRCAASTPAATGCAPTVARPSTSAACWRCRPRPTARHARRSTSGRRPRTGPEPSPGVASARLVPPLPARRAAAARLSGP